MIDIVFAGFGLLVGLIVFVGLVGILFRVMKWAGL